MAVSELTSGEVLQLPLWLDLAAVSVGAIFGSLLARNRRLDFMGVLVVGTLMALGGGMLRDILLSQVPVALRNPWFLPTAVVVLFVTQLFAQLFERPRWLMLGLDAVFLALFTIIGVEKANVVGLPFAGAVFVGVVAGTGGGVLGDLISGVRPIIVSPGGPLYASIALTGAIVYEVVHYFAQRPVAQIVTFVVIVVFRLIAVKREWTGVAVDELAPDFTPLIAKPVRKSRDLIQRNRDAGDDEDDAEPETS